MATGASILTRTRLTASFPTLLGRVDVRAYLQYVPLACALALGAMVRLRHLLAVDFPLNDGGLFYVMARDIQNAGYSLPEYTSYNGGSIPFAYPPFGLYLSAAIDDLSPLTLLDVLRFLPLAANLLTIVVVFLFARSITRSQLIAGISAIAFALMPRGYMWMIMGGGITRGVAFLFAAIALHQAFLLYSTRKTLHLIATIVFAALAVATHPEVGWFLAFSCGLLWFFYGRNAEATRDSIIVALGVAAMTAPWWGLVLARHGAGPFLSAAQTGEQSWDAWRALLDWDFTEQPLLNWPAVLGILGGIILLARGQPFLLAWLVAIVLLEPRSAASYATIPLAILSAVCIERLIVTLPVSPEPPPAAQHRDPAGAAKRLAPVFAIALLGLYLLSVSLYGAMRPVPALSTAAPSEREAMAWIDENAPRDSRFVVITGVRAKFMDATMEWFPALARRQSVATVQGSEWLGADAYEGQAERQLELQECASEELDLDSPSSGDAAYCLYEWEQEHSVEFTHVYVTANCCPELAEWFSRDPRYELLVDINGSRIFRVRPSRSAS